mgnify:CR=1 FL=1
MSIWCLVVIGRWVRQHGLEKAEFRESYRQSFLKVQRVVGGSRGHSDLSIWNPNLLSERAFSASGGKNEEETFIAIEMSLNEHRKTARINIQWDLLSFCHVFGIRASGTLLAP